MLQRAALARLGEFQAYEGRASVCMPGIRCMSVDMLSVRPAITCNRVSANLWPDLQ